MPSPSEVMGSIASELRKDPTVTNVLELRFDPRASSPDVLYGSKVQARRSANARVLCANVLYKEDLSDLDPGQIAAVTSAFSTLPAATASSGWILGEKLAPLGRGQGQAAAMNNWNARGAAAFANRHMVKATSTGRLVGDPALGWSRGLEVEVGGAGTVAAAGVVVVVPRL